MSTYSTSSVYTISRDDLISRALAKLGLTDVGEEHTQQEISDAAICLNLMIKEWMALGIDLWVRQVLTLPIVPGTEKYTIGPGGDLDTDRPQKILNAYREDDSGNDVVVDIISDKEYNALSQKDSPGPVNQIHYNPTLDQGELFVWPTGDSSSDTDTLVLSVIGPIRNADAGTDNLFFPQEWLNALVWGLAADLSPEYGIPLPRVGMLRGIANQKLQRLLDYNVGEASVTLGVDTQGMMR